MTTNQDELRNECWQQYQSGLDYQRRNGVTDDTLKAYRFYEGDQWYGLESADESMPVYNFIMPLVKYKTAMIALNNMTITYSAPSSDQRQRQIASALNQLAMERWERAKMDSVCWQVVRKAAIAGECFLYFYDGQGGCQVIDNTDVFLADEQQSDLDKQPYILFRERRIVDEVKKTAAKNGVGASQASLIQPDEDDSGYTDESIKKCTCILKLWLADDGLHFIRCTRNAIVQPEQVIKGLYSYPVARLIFNSQYGTARGKGEVLPLIPNQIEVNRSLARRLINGKLTAYSRLIYSSERVLNPKALTEVGSAIEVESGGVSSINDAVGYLSPSPMSSDAASITTELMETTRELAGAGDAALGNFNPELASGVAIIAVRDQAALPLNEQTAAFKQMVEDVALIWYSLWAAYNPLGLTVSYDGVETLIQPDELRELRPNIRVDVSSANPFSKYAREQSLGELFQMGAITFDEYVWALDDDSSVPKTKLKEIIKMRGAVAAQADQQQIDEFARRVREETSAK